MAYNAGTAYLQIIPSFRNFERTLGRDVRNLGKAFGNSLSTEFSEAFDKALGDSLAKAASGKLTNPISETLSKDSDRAAAELFEKLRDAVLKGLREGSKDGTGDLEKDATAAARRIGAEQERAAKAAAAAAEREAKKAADAQEREAKRAARTLERELVQAQQRAAKEVERAFGRTWAGRITRGLQAAIDQVSGLDNKIVPDSIAIELDRIRQKLLELRDVQVGVDLDEAEFQAEVAAAIA